MMKRRLSRDEVGAGRSRREQARRLLPLLAGAAAGAALLLLGVTGWLLSRRDRRPAPAPAGRPEIKPDRIERLLKEGRISDALRALEEVPPPERAAKRARIQGAAFSRLADLRTRLDQKIQGHDFAAARNLLTRFREQVRGLPSVVRRVEAELAWVDLLAGLEQETRSDGRKGAADRSGDLARRIGSLKEGEHQGAVRRLEEARRGADPELQSRLGAWIGSLRAPNPGERPASPGAARNRQGEALRLFESGRLDEAVTAFTDILTESPRNAPVLALRAHALLLLDRTDMARADGRRALAIDPQEPRAHLVLGEIARRDRRLQSAESHFSRALEAFPVQARYGRALVHSALGQWRRAAVDLQKAADLAPRLGETSAAYRIRAHAAAIEGDHRGAIRTCTEWLRLDPDNPEALELRGDCHRAMGNKAAARTDYEAALRHAPGDPGLTAKLAALEAPPPPKTAVKWSVRFKDLVRKYSKGDPVILAGLRAALDDAAAEARASFEEAERACRILEEHEALFRAEPDLRARRRTLYEIRFDHAIRRATGPAQLRALRRWCAERRLKDRIDAVEAVLNGLCPAPTAAERERIRHRREEARRAAYEYLHEQGTVLCRGVRSILQWATRIRFAPPDLRRRLESIVREIVLDPTERAEWLQRIGSLPHEEPPAGLRKKHEREFRRRLDRILAKFADRLLKGVDKSIAQGEPGVGFDLLQHLLRVDPENRRARRGLGHVRIQGRWLRKYEADRFREGWNWDDRLGWVRRGHAERYARGEYYDPDSGRWGRLEAWNRAHADVANPWRIRSEHFELISTADLEVTVRALRRLEAFYLQVFRRLDLFFTGDSTDQGARLIFAVGSLEKPLRVHLYRDEAQFRAHAGPDRAWVDGFYDPNRRASYFYARKDGVPFPVLQHEITHQILGEFARAFLGAERPVWIVEGVAVFMENAAIDEDGRMRIDPLQNPRLIRYRERLRTGSKELSLREILQLRTREDWDGPDMLTKYRAVGAAFAFLMSFDGGRYRGDCVDMLRDAYTGKFQGVEAYFGWTVDSLERLMQRFYVECAP